jgi:glutathione peroxidase-family protein
MRSSLLDFTMKDITGIEVPLRTFEGRVLLLVNVASKCGFTPQYKGLQELYEMFKDRGFTILAFPANNFLWQEPGTDAQIREFCTTNYGITFPLFSRISVKGKDIHPLYDFLTSPATNPAFAGKIGWNFAKFLADRAGSVIARFEPRKDPMSSEIVQAVEAALAEQAGRVPPTAGR